MHSIVDLPTDILCTFIFSFVGGGSFLFIALTTKKFRQACGGEPETFVREAAVSPRRARLALEDQ